MIENYDIYHHFLTPSHPLMIGITIDVNDDNCGPPLKKCILQQVKTFVKLHQTPSIHLYYLLVVEEVGGTSMLGLFHVM